MSDQQAPSVMITAARNARRITDVPEGGKLDVLNRFFAEDDSTPLAFINHVRRDMSLPRFISCHCRNFRSFVIGNLRDNVIASLPRLYRQHNSGG